MPSIKERMVPAVSDDLEMSFPRIKSSDSETTTTAEPYSGSGVATQFSIPSGNPAPHRGLAPIEYQYDFDIHYFHPHSAYFVRSSVDVNTQIRNLALQAFKGKV